MLASWHSLLLVLTRLGIEKKWWQRREEFPLWNPTDVLEVYRTLGNRASEDAGDDSAITPGLQELRKKTANQLHMSRMILANPMLKSLVAIMCVVARPVSTGHAAMVQGFKSCEGSLKYWVSCAAGAWEHDMREILGCFKSEERLKEIGFRTGASAQTDQDEDEELMRTKCVEFAFQLVGLLARVAVVVGGVEVLGGDDARQPGASRFTCISLVAAPAVGEMDTRCLGGELFQLCAGPCCKCAPSLFRGGHEHRTRRRMRAEQRRSPNHQMSRPMRWWHVTEPGAAVGQTGIKSRGRECECNRTLLAEAVV
eukprot:6469648-Amphidinium_carterae.2